MQLHWSQIGWDALPETKPFRFILCSVSLVLIQIYYAAINELLTHARRALERFLEQYSYGALDGLVCSLGRVTPSSPSLILYLPSSCLWSFVLCTIDKSHCILPWVYRLYQRSSHSKMFLLFFLFMAMIPTIPTFNLCRYEYPTFLVHTLHPKPEYIYYLP